MNINGKDINIDDLFDQKYMHKEIKKVYSYHNINVKYYKDIILIHMNVLL